MKMKLPTIIMGILLILGGVFCLITPIATFRVIGWIIGFLLLVAGANLIVDYFTLRKSGRVNTWDLAGGFFTIVLALIILYRHGYARNFLDDFIVVIFGVWMLFSGIFRIASGAQLKKAKVSSWFLVMLSGVLALLLGIYGLFNPYVFKFAISWMIGCFIIMQGLSLLGLGIMMHKTHKGDVADCHTDVIGDIADDVEKGSKAGEDTTPTT